MSIRDLLWKSFIFEGVVLFEIFENKTPSKITRYTVYTWVEQVKISALYRRGILPYLAQRGSRPGPLFLFQDGRMLTRHLFSTAVDELLTELHIDKELYNTHSFRIGAATSAIQANIPEVHIQMLGRWKSEAYKWYVRTSPQELARLSKQLAADGPSPSS